MNESRKNSKAVVVATRGVTVRDFFVFQVKLALEGARDFLAMNLSVVALVIDILSGRGRRPRRFYTVVRWSRRFDGWLRLHNMRALQDAQEDYEEPVPPELGASDGPHGIDRGRRVGGPDADALVEQFESLVRRKSRRD